MYVVSQISFKTWPNRDGSTPLTQQYIKCRQSFLVHSYIIYEL